jgi:hypothetical protein
VCVCVCLCLGNCIPEPFFFSVCLDAMMLMLMLLFENDSCFVVRFISAAAMLTEVDDCRRYFFVQLFFEWRCFGDFVVSVCSF